VLPWIAGTVNAIIRVNHNGTWTQVADLSAFQKAHPVANPEPDDFEPDGTWYSMVGRDPELMSQASVIDELLLTIAVSPNSIKEKKSC